MRRAAKYFIISVALSAVMLLLDSCSTRHVPKGTPIQVSGYVIDTTQNKRLAGVKIYLVGGNYYSTLATSMWDWWTLAVDSAVTDANGSFTIQYKADGKSESYALVTGEFFNRKDVERNGDPYYPLSTVAGQIAGAIKNKAIYAREHVFVKIHLTAEPNPFDTLMISVTNDYENRYYYLAGKNIHTGFIVKCLPGAKNRIEYGATFYKSEKSGESKQVTDTITPGINDTAVISRTIY